ncbi:unnamed protein product, partial [Oppiella nova]
MSKGYYYDDYEEDYNYGPQDGYAMDPSDPNYDSTYAQNFVPDLVQDFLVLLRKAIIDRNVYDIQNLYENTFVKLSETYYSDSPWPEREELAAVVPLEESQIFTILYKELYYRHIYAKCQPTLKHRFLSYYNYCNLFNYILSAEKPVALELPNQWLWDIIDEFIYQFQSFSIYKGKTNRPEQEEEQLLKSPQVWNVHSVINVLHSLVDKSNINEQLKEFSIGRDPDLVSGEFGRQPLYKMLGYFSLIGLLRLHSLLGDYYQAIKVLENIDLNRQQLQMMATAPVLACQTTTFYYVGFAYIMMRRYS